MSEQKIVCQHCGKVLESYEACGLKANGEIFYLCERCCFGPAAEHDCENEGEKTHAA